MGRRRESFLKRIARHVGHTEESLTAFLTAETKSCLIWTGTFKPRITKAVLKQMAGLQFPSIRYPRPTLSPDGLSPTRLLFCIYHELPELDPKVFLQRQCTDPACISPFHRTPKVTFKHGERQFAVIPPLKSSPIDGLVDMFRECEEDYRHHPENLVHYPPELVAAAFSRLGW